MKVNYIERYNLALSVKMKILEVLVVVTSKYSIDVCRFSVVVTKVLSTREVWKFEVLLTRSNKNFHQYLQPQILLKLVAV